MYAPANEMRLKDPKQIVTKGYDRVGGLYAEQAVQSRTEDRLRYESTLVEGLPAGAGVLDLGCGAGVPTTRRLARHFKVTGVDISGRQIARARRSVPGASFIHGDMTKLDMPAGSFDGVAAFFSIIHVPREEHLGLLEAIEAWLRPGGLFVAAMSAGAKEATFARDWLGAPMYWSGFDSETNKRLTETAGLELISARVESYDDDGLPGRFLWVLARKPSPAST